MVIRNRVSQKGIYSLMLLVVFMFAGFFGMLPILGIGLGIMGTVFTLYYVAQRCVADYVFWGFWTIIAIAFIFH